MRVGVLAKNHFRTFLARYVSSTAQPALCIHAQKKGGGVRRPPPKPAKKCIGWVEKREKKERKGENQAKVGKIRLKID